MGLAKRPEDSNYSNELDISKGQQDLSQLEWVGLLQDMQVQSPDQEGMMDKLRRKTREEPMVPIGVAATTACLTMGLFAMKRGDSKRQQFFMRGRVFAQVFTIVAITGGLLHNLSKKGTNEVENVKQV
ncbi:HIG1 domain family member 2A [Halotydeus destructor]|nr:HIG1 domain family member 2A [Halotydeus destructor]